MLVLRPLRAADSPLLVAYLNDKCVTRYLSSNIPSPYTIGDAQWFLEIGCKQDALNKAIVYNDTFCGVVGVYFKQEDYAHSAEIGYWLAESFWGLGIATHAVKQFVASVFSDTQITRIYNPVTADNKASIRVMEKAGFKLEGIHRQAVMHSGALYDECLYAMVKG